MSIKSQPFGRLYYDKKCTIFELGTGLVDGSLVNNKMNTLFNNIDCDFWLKDERNLTNDDLSTLTSELRYEVNFKPDVTGLKKGYYIELFDTAGSSLGTFIVERVLPYNSYDGSLGNTQIIVKETSNVNSI